MATKVHYKQQYATKTACGRGYKHGGRTVTTFRKEQVTCPTCLRRMKSRSVAFGEGSTMKIRVGDLKRVLREGWQEQSPYDSRETVLHPTAPIVKALRGFGYDEDADEGAIDQLYSLMGMELVPAAVEEWVSGQVASGRLNSVDARQLSKKLVNAAQREGLMEW